MGNERDYIKLEYADEEFVFVPIEQVNLVQRYIGNEGEKPHLDKIGSKSWRKTKMPEYDYFNGENFITFDLIEIDDEKREVTVAVSDTGRISVKTFDLLFDGNRRYFEYGCLYTKIYIDEFTEEN